MKRFKKPKNKKKPIVITQSKMNKVKEQIAQEAVAIAEQRVAEIKDDITNEAMIKAVCLIVAYLIEEQDIDFNKDRMADMVAGIDRWAEAIDEHLITLRDVADIIYEIKGVRLEW